MGNETGRKLDTLAVHAGQEPDSYTGAVMPPIYQTSTYVQDAVGKPRGGFEYARVSNPTRSALEGNLAALEGGAKAAAFASGLAALEAILKAVLDAGAHVVCEDNVYGGTERMFRTVWSRFGLDFTYVSTSNLDALEAAIRPETGLVLIETPTNPLMQVSDIAACAEIAHSTDALLCVDNTFATPFLQRPLELGADLVVHSTTKYLNGHSDVIGGAAIAKDPDVGEDLLYQQKATGAVPGPLDCWLVLRGIKTLHLRMRRHCESAGRIATHLAEHPSVHRVFYPGLPDHPQHELALEQMCGFGGMITFDVGSADRARRVAGATTVFALAESLGGVESLISVPVEMTHASVQEARRGAIGLTEGLVRLSVGVEDCDDLLADIDQALAAAGPAERSSEARAETASPPIA